MAKTYTEMDINIDAKMDKDMDAEMDMDMDTDMDRVRQVYFILKNEISSGDRLNIFLCQMPAEEKNSEN
jgi:hypothetical protein